MQKQILFALVPTAAIGHARCQPPAGFTISKNTLSPDKRFGILVPDEKRYDAGEKNKLVEVGTPGIDCCPRGADASEC